MFWPLKKTYFIRRKEKLKKKKKEVYIYGDLHTFYSFCKFNYLERVHTVYSFCLLWMFSYGRDIDFCSLDSGDLYVFLVNLLLLW